MFESKRWIGLAKQRKSQPLANRETSLPRGVRRTDLTNRRVVVFTELRIDRRIACQIVTGKERRSQIRCENRRHIRSEGHTVAHGKLAQCIACR